MRTARHRTHLLRNSTLAVLLVASPTGIAFAAPADEIRQRLLQWTEDFNAGRKAESCELFSKALISDYRGQGEAGYATRCRLIEKAIDDPIRKFRYEPAIKEVIVEGSFAVVRLDWTLTIAPGDIKATEPGMDIFRREADGRWRIIRYMAYEEDSPAK